MTHIDPSADIELISANEHVQARIPLAGQVTGQWLGSYHRLARAVDVPVQAETSQITSATTSTTNPIEAMTSSACDSHDGPRRKVPVEMIPVAITKAK
jgi:hypothetical protein